MAEPAAWPFPPFYVSYVACPPPPTTDCQTMSSTRTGKREARPVFGTNRRPRPPPPHHHPCSPPLYSVLPLCAVFRAAGYALSPTSWALPTSYLLQQRPTSRKPAQVA
jgi:hypothetical protein